MNETSLSRTLKVAGFRRLWLGLMVFNVGHLIQVVASAWLILELTGSPLWVSLMVAAPTLPLLLLSLPAGAAADLFDRRLILMVSAGVMASAAAGMAILWVLDLITPGRLVILGLIVGIGVAFLNPAMQAIVPALVPTSMVPGAVSLNSATAGVANALGPTAGGILVGTVGPGWSFAVAGCGYLAMVVAILRTDPIDGIREKSKMGSAIATGVRYLRFSSGFQTLLLLGSLFGFTTAALRAMLPNLTSDVLNAGPAAYGLLLGAFGVGAVVGGLTRAFGASFLGRWMVPVSITATGVVGVVAGLSTFIVLTGGAVFVSGLLWSWILATLISTFQLLSPDWVRGRTMSAFVLSVFGFVPLGGIAAGQLGSAFGASTSLTMFSVGVVGTGLLASRMNLPVLEDIEPPTVPDTAPNRTPFDSTRDVAPVLVTNQWVIEESRFGEFCKLLVGLRRLRLSTGANDWAAYRSAHDDCRISEVYRVNSWEEHLQQQGRFDMRALEILREVHSFGTTETVSDHLIAFDVDKGPGDGWLTIPNLD